MLFERRRREGNAVEEPRGPIDMLLRHRYILYLVLIGGLIVWKLWPTVRSSMQEIDGLAEDTGGRIVIAGLDCAPEFVLQAVAQFKSQYPAVELQMNGGGTVAALEDLLNRKADVAVLSRAPTAREQRIAVERGDSLLYFPVALGGISILASRASGLESLTLDEVRGAFAAGGAAPSVGGRPVRPYGPDPNSGLWEALLDRLEVGLDLAPSYAPVVGGEEVLAALRGDPAGIGFVSDLTFSLAANDAELRELAVATAPASAFEPTKANIVNGSYPLYHYVYLCTTQSRGTLAAGFVTYYTHSTGQRWVARRGFMPAKLPAREIHLTGKTAS
jgi:phosphate transport system substrate-binding protein